MNQNYYYGRPENMGSYETVMSILAGREAVNSERTSSLPLAQFWYPRGLGGRIAQLLDGLEIDLNAAKMYFEYATPLPKGPYGTGKASMTDLMVLTDEYRIAIEAKYTEYMNLKYEKISSWKSKNPENRELVLNGWLQYLKKYGCTTNLPDVPYQLLHRVASACAGSECPVVVYHLFWDDTLKDKVDKFAEQLWDWFNALSLCGVKFIVAKTHVEPKFSSEDDLSELFLRMKENPYGSMCGTKVLVKGEWR